MAPGATPPPEVSGADACEVDGVCARDATIGVGGESRSSCIVADNVCVAVIVANGSGCAAGPAACGIGDARASSPVAVGAGAAGGTSCGIGDARASSPVAVGAGAAGGTSCGISDARASSPVADAVAVVGAPFTCART